MSRAILCLSNASLSKISIPDGKTVLPVNDVPTLLSCIGSDKNYSTIEELITDVDLCYELCSARNSVDYLVRSESFASPISSVCEFSRISVKDYYIRNLFFANDTWRYALCTSNPETILPYCDLDIDTEWIPANAFSSDNYSSSYDAKRAFYGESSSGWLSTNVSDGTATNRWVAYHFTFSFKLMVVRFLRYLNGTGYKSSSGGDRNKAFKMQGSNDGTTWEDVSDKIYSKDTVELQYHAIPCTEAYSYYRMYILESRSGYSAGSLALNFYGSSVVG